MYHPGWQRHLQVLLGLLLGRLGSGGGTGTRSRHGGRDHGRPRLPVARRRRGYMHPVGHILDALALPQQHNAMLKGPIPPSVPLTN